MNRRDFIRYAGLSSAGAIVIPVGLSGCAVAPPVGTISRATTSDAPLAYGTPKKRPHADGEGPPRMIVVFLRGAVDGLNVVVPYGDHEYYQARPGIAVARPGAANGVIDLTGYFGLHPALRPLMPYWDSGQLAFVHASGSPYSSRSHFEAQDYMETGTPGQHNTRDGWLNRLQGYLPQENSPVQALALGESIPRILTGPQVVANMSTGRDAARPTLIDQPKVSQAFGTLYASDDALGKAYRDGVAARKELMSELSSSEQRMANNGAPLPNGLAIDTARLGRLMRSDTRIRLGFLAVGGWDTHANQGNGTGQLAGRLNPLAVGLATLAQELGPAFNDTVIVVVSEFGRTFRENGNGGTDHGHGNAIWLLGGNVRGGTIYGQWPGLNKAALNEGRDLAITTDFRAVMSTLAEKHLRIRDSALEKIFPQYTTGLQHVSSILV
ncbi:uncharacterized protein (DUF1501 family) [Herbaspirillum sp. Sphag1AN]|uniref:DUF1501 domain-containing protein n=1 Tax=unclassified Herbaspirillum TaxID=2624150 RepID=UPI00161E6DB2|nr:MULTISPECIES: DUF1501 domain-containing protein [unclassified Herbaspirillum]MBB3213376.1 uncharacterized protein (DUF1501 family) [Herbaspirillum sp. Sphag1AN]MBB3246580.1 uncharacterized protein (DUF1501 family) [Herbaspirillum sp. Sphag64]